MSKANRGNKARNVHRRRHKDWKWRHKREKYSCPVCRGSRVRVAYGRGLKAHVACYCVFKRR